MDQQTTNTLRVVLIKPSKYDDDGYVIRFWRGVLPSNTLNVLNGLTESVKGRFPDLNIEVVTFDETTQRVPVKKIIRWSRRYKLVVGLVGVQTNQYPRAFDMGKEFRKAGIDVILGGFHTSGTINMLGEQEPDIQDLVRHGITIVSGEVEEAWGDILADAISGQLKPIYSFAQDLRNLVDLGDAPPPVVSQETMKHFAVPSFGTLDTSRGCPFACSFCTIINVQGRKMRERSPQRVADLIRSNYAKGINFYFFTDDNFARKKLWRQTFESIIKLREEGIKIEFMMQVDLARKPKDFVELAARAGCSQVFIGMESVNPKNLAAEGKGQNNVNEYAEIVSGWQRAGVEVHTGYIIGLPHDTKEQVTRDVQYLMQQIQPDQASFFMLTPLPGSHDHREMRKQGVWMDADFNKRDSFHATIEHPNMTAEEWTEAYNTAWTSFYNKENLVRILGKWKDDPKRYWSLMGNLLWYKNAALIEKEHPMIAGFFRMKDRRIRRPGFAVDPLPVHLWKRTKEVTRLLVAWVKLLKEFEEIWLQTRKMSATEERWLTELEKIQGEIWQTLRIRELQEMYQRAGAALPARARKLLSSLDDLSSRSLLSTKDLTVFVKRWQKLQERVQDLQKTLSHESEQAQRTVEEFCRVLKNTKPKAKIHDWQESYRRLRQDLPSRLRMGVVRFDALSNRIICSRQDLHNFWDTTVHSVKAFRFWRIPPHRLLTALIKDFSLTASFASELQANRARID